MELLLVVEVAVTIVVVNVAAVASGGDTVAATLAVPL